MSHGTSYTITMDQLCALADTACILDDRNIIPADHVRVEIVGKLHHLVETIAGPDACLIYAEGA